MEILLDFQFCIGSFFFYFRLILLSLICLMTRDALGREIECDYKPWEHIILWPGFIYCQTENIDYSANFEGEKHFFSGSTSRKFETATFAIVESPQVDFIPLDILTEFSNLNGLGIWKSKLSTVKLGLFKKEFERIEYLNLWNNGMDIFNKMLERKVFFIFRLLG
jgi:hypothetical protein